MATNWTPAHRLRWTEQDIDVLRKYWDCGPGVVAFHLNER